MKNLIYGIVITMLVLVVAFNGAILTDHASINMTKDITAIGQTSKSTSTWETNDLGMMKELSKLGYTISGINIY